MKLETFDRPKKAEAFELVLKIAGGGTLTPHEASLLVNYFSPPLPAKAKTPWDYVAKAVYCDDDRLLKFLNYVHVRGGTAYACNRKRMHYAPVDKQDGLYSASGVSAAVTVVDDEAQQWYGDRMEGIKPKTLGQWETTKLDDCEKFLDPEKKIRFVKVGEGMFNLQDLMPAINHQVDFRYQVVPRGILVECGMGMAVVAEYRIKQVRRDA